MDGGGVAEKFFYAASPRRAGCLQIASEQGRRNIILRRRRRKLPFIARKTRRNVCSAAPHTKASIPKFKSRASRTGRNPGVAFLI